MITTTRGHFWIEFDNGYKISVFNDWGSYSDNHFNTKLEKGFIENSNEEISSSNCEVAIIYNNSLVNIFGWDDDVKGYVTPNELLEIMNKVSKLKGDK